MKKNKKNKRKELEDFFRYTSNQMTGRERHLFEKDLQKDPFDAEAAEGYSTQSFEESRQDNQELLKRLSSRIAGSAGKSNRFIFYRAAAAVVSILIVGTIIVLLTSDLNQMFRKTAITEMNRSENEVKPTIAPAVTDAKTVAGASRQKDEITAKIVEDEEVVGDVELKTAEKTTGMTETRKAVHQVKIDESIEAEAAAEIVTIDKGLKPATDASGRIITRKYVDNYVRGVVLSSEDQLPLPGATVKIRGTSAGTYTDQNGNFELPVLPDTSITLVADYIGMEQKEVSTDAQDNVQITLSPSEAALNEVVVIGYGVQKKSDLTGAVSAVEMNESPDYQFPSPTIGNRNYKQYIKENLQFPAGDTAISRAVVVLNFVIAENGRPKNIAVMKSPGQAFSEEAIRLLVSGPDWFPARRDGKIIEDETMIRIVFKPEY